METQEKIAGLKASTLWCARLMFLQLPVWSTFYLHPNMLQPGIGMSIQIVITTSLCFVAIWLFFNIKYENRDKRWFQFIFGGKEWAPMLQAMELLEEIRFFQDEGQKEDYV